MEHSKVEYPCLIKVNTAYKREFNKIGFNY